MSNTHHSLPNLKGKPYGGAWSIRDDLTQKAVDAFVYTRTDHIKFCLDYKEWFTKGHALNGVDSYQHVCFTNGTTETFDKFYHRHFGKRLRLYKGEYFYHQIMSRFYKEFAWVGDDPITTGDALVVSCPFSDTGDVPEGLESILQQCDDAGVPVCVDLAYINISKPLNIDLSHKCIEDITTSLSKMFPVEHHRIGIRLQRTLIDDSLYAYNNNGYVNHYSVSMGQWMIEQFDNDYIVKNYEKLQKEYCEKLNVRQSGCVIFGIDTNNQYNEYNRGATSNRLCFSRTWDRRIDV